MLRGVLLAAVLAAAAEPALAQAVVQAATGEAPYQVAVTSWRDLPFRRVVRQQYDFSCGSAALATLLTYQYGRPTSETDTFKAMFAAGDQAKIRKQGFSMLDMKNYLTAKGLKSDGYRMTMAELAEQKTPAITLISMGTYKHFVVVKGVKGGLVVVGDPALGERAMPVKEFEGMWNGAALMIHPDAQAGTFNAAADWELRQGAPYANSVSRLTISDLTSNLAPIYQLTPSRATPGVGP